jgi:predicted ATPase
LLERHMQVLELAAGEDYRQQAQRPWGGNILAAAADADLLLRQRLQLDAAVPAPLTINRRRIALRGLSASALWVDFVELFQQATAVADYLWYAHALRIWRSVASSRWGAARWMCSSA